MKKIFLKITSISLFLMMIFSSFALAADKPINMQVARSGNSRDNIRIVFQFDTLPVYQANVDSSGKKITLDFSGVSAADVQNSITADGNIVQNVQINSIQSGTRVTISLNQATTYTINTLQNPARVFIDLVKSFEQTNNQNLADGIDYITYTRSDNNGALKAYILDIDPTKYELIPVLGAGRQLGKSAVSDMVRYYSAIAGVNASYFGGSKEVFGLTMIDGTVATTTYLSRTAFGTDVNGKAIIAPVSYTGVVHTKNGDLPINGVNCDRNADTVVEYNSFYGNSTGTNEYGVEYTVQDNKIIKINTNNSQLKDGQYVISAHGTMADALSGLKVGDAMSISENFGSAWQNALQIVGVGPQLVDNGQVNITADAEQIGPDVTGGIAPRTAAAIKANGHVLLVVVDGRQSQSRGLSLTGMAQLLIKFGAMKAVNFDGGGSSEMVVKNDIVNSPSDGMERPVGVTLAVVKKS